MTKVEEVKDRAIIVEDGMESYSYLYATTETIKLQDFSLKNKIGKYACNNLVIGFVDETGTMYVIPELPGIQLILQSAGYIKDNFYVPFSNSSAPVSQLKKWTMIWEERMKI